MFFSFSDRVAINSLRRVFFFGSGLNSQNITIFYRRRFGMHPLGIKKGNGMLFFEVSFVWFMMD